MALRKEQIISQQCYICGMFFQDKVRLGVHIARCYEEAMDRGESWHPHPDILLDEVRYSQYMMSGEREKQFKSAEKKKVAYSTQDEFAGLHSQLGTSSPINKKQQQSSSPPMAKMPPSNVPTSTYQSDFNKNKGTNAPTNSSPIDHVPGGDRVSTPRSNNNNNNNLAAQGRGGGGGGGYSLPPSNNSSPSSKVTFAQPGINTLRNELASELDKVRMFMQDEKRRAAERDAVLHSLVDGASNTMGQVQQRSSGSGGYSLSPSSSPPSSSPNKYYGTTNMPPAGRPSSSSSSNTNNNTPRGGGGGYHNPLDGNNQLAPVPSAYNPNANAAPSALKAGFSGGGGGGGNSTPRSRGSRSGGGEIIGAGGPDQKIISPDDNPNVKMMHTDIGRAIHGGGFEADPHQRVPCGRCGRMFAPDRVDAHEQVCVSKPAGIHRK